MWRANIPPRTRVVLHTSALHVNIGIFAKRNLVVKPRNVFIQGYTNVSEVTSVELPPLLISLATLMASNMTSML